MILEVLKSAKSLKDGDVVFFADSGCEFGQTGAALAELDTLLGFLMPGDLDSVGVVAFT